MKSNLLIFFLILGFGSFSQKDAFFIYHEPDSSLNYHLLTSLVLPESHDTISEFLYPTQLRYSGHYMIPDSIYKSMLNEIDELINSEKYSTYKNVSSEWGCTSFLLFDKFRNITSQFTLKNKEVTLLFINELLERHQDDESSNYYHHVFDYYIFKLENP